ncbi:YgiQ family radical SAM protein [Deferribacter autotrophicus]|uniref:YgiQ family radical SAM protein n=2 Tax=Deferribacter autotrophicus TaxID=500465 RepID=A0A5A8F746_9BACT|nr:YgiQ family radical SAM protein [Deferribacter autotrophicus]
MFLPITKEELKKLGWKNLDIIFVTGDAYIDSPYIGVALLGKLLVKNGFKVGIISQPDLKSSHDILRLGTPRLFWGVTAGSIDSMVANYTPLKKRRKSDDFTPGGKNNRRPDRATIRYVNLIKQYDKTKKPIVIGGIEASLRRIAHYDYWDDSIRRSILFDSKADILVYGMGEKTILELAKRFAKNDDYKDVRGICYISKETIHDFTKLPSFEQVTTNKNHFIEMMKIFYENQDPVNANGLIQQYDSRLLIHNPPQWLPNEKELDSYYELDFEYDVHPYLKKQGEVKAIHTIKNSITINRGCFGECNFCAIAVHQGTRVVSRSIPSIIKEVERLKKTPYFKGIINDLGGPTANMYGYECDKKQKFGKCKHKRCIFPDVCDKMTISHEKLITLMRKVREIDGVKRVFIQSGLRYDLILKDKLFGDKYLEELIRYHISGQLKIAPEHLENDVLALMGKPSNKILGEFVKKFYAKNRELGKKQFLTYYIIVAHPGCSFANTKKLKNKLLSTIRTIPEQIQIFTPLPLTWSSVMYYTEKDPFTGKKIYVEKNLKKKAQQKNYLLMNKQKSNQR